MTTEIIIVATIAGLGAAGLGFVMGWTLYFANRGKAGQLSTSDLAAIAGVIAGGAIIGSFGDAGGSGEAKMIVFGTYGMGLFAGFWKYFTLYRAASKEGRIAMELESLITSPSVTDMGALETPMRRMARSATTETPFSMSPAKATVEADLEACLADTDALALDLAQAYMDESDAGKLAEIRESQRKLDAFRRKLNVRLAISYLSSDELKAFLSTLKIETGKLNAEAAKMKKAATDIQKVADLLGSAKKLIDSLQSII